MLGQDYRTTFPFIPLWLPKGNIASSQPLPRPWLTPLICLLLTFLISTAARLLEFPYWETQTYTVQNEYLLATHDAYHWIAGAEGFEFGAGHPMSELVRAIAWLCSTQPANAGFWLPPFMGGFTAISLFLWGMLYRAPYAGMCAGIIASLSPAFLARTMLGFCDTDLIVLPFAILIGLAPALWLLPWLQSVPQSIRKLVCIRRQTYRQDSVTFPKCPEPRLRASLFGKHYIIQERSLYQPGSDNKQEPAPLCPERLYTAMLSPGMLTLLIVWGIFCWWTQEWHSFFPYLIRFSALAILGLILFCTPRAGKQWLLHGALCHCLPLLLGWWGVPLAALYAYGLVKLPVYSATKLTEQQETTGTLHKFLLQLINLRARPIWLWVTWTTLVLLCLDLTTFQALFESFAAYADRTGDMSSMAQGANDPLIFPSVAQSIIEIQEVSFKEVSSYIYPHELISYCAFFAFLILLIMEPAFIWFAPLLLLSMLSTRMGARMTMFGVPALILPLFLCGGLLLEQLYLRLVLYFSRNATGHSSQKTNKSTSQGLAQYFRFYFLQESGFPLFSLVKGLCALYIVMILAWPLILHIPHYTQGPIISKQQAEALLFIQKTTPEDSVVWNWWDWGYATHHFARRHTIADGARHGGPSLFLPAAVYTTSDPRFARQLIKYTATKDNQPGNVFANLSASEAQKLINSLKNPSTPLIQAPGKQYLVVNVEQLPLGVWITTYGSWNFKTKQGRGALLNNLGIGLDLNLQTGEIIPKEGDPVYAKSIDIFSPEGLSHNEYTSNGYHFIFTVNQLDTESYQNNTASMLLSQFWQNQAGAFYFSTPVDEKLVVDSSFYNTLMTQLLLAPAGDPAIAPYFKLIFDNTYSRVYEVQ